MEDVPDAEILRGLRSQGVTELYRVTRKMGEGRVPTHTFFLTFTLPALPEFIKVGYLRVKVDLFVPAPLRCFNCQRFGHSRGRCNKDPICERCGQAGHEDTCSQTPKCSNCGGDHSPNSRNCPTFKFEQAIQKVKTEKKISFAEAKKEVQKTRLIPTTSYANVVKKSVPSSSHGAQVGSGIPPGMLEQLRKEFPNVN